MKSHNSLMQAELVSTSFFELIKVRLPWLVIGLAGGAMASVTVSRFETSLQENIALAFFIPVITYMSDSVGTQTETIFIRALTDLKFNISKYIIRELFVGALLGSILGLITGIFGSILVGSVAVGWVVGLSLFLSMTVATVLACITPLALRFFGKDPAAGSGPISTALQDVISLLIYFSVVVAVLG